MLQAGKDKRERYGIGERTATRFHELSRMLADAAASDYPLQVERAAEFIGDALAAGRKLLVFGNGGSASDAQHICGELVVRFERERHALPAIALTCDSSVLTACANDFAYERVFARQIEALGQEGDVALGISTSGNSANVVCAFQTARARGMVTILLTGSGRAATATACDLVLAAPATLTARIQELHLVSYHTICELLDARFAV